MLARRQFLLTAAAGTLSAASDSVASLGGAISLYYGAEWDKPFLYPLRTVSGHVLSRRYPVESAPGENTDHGWHRGLWWGHGLINGQDFWREQGHDKTARLVSLARPLVRRHGVDATFAMVIPGGVQIGTNQQIYTVTDADGLRCIDARIVIRADRKVPLQFGDTEDGGFAFRLQEPFREDQGARLRNSEGQEGTANIWGKPARWVDYSAVIAGQRRGVAIFDHPKNLRHPTRWHARGYGLCAANPFATKGFTKGQGADGAYTIPAGKSLTLRYRVVVHEGEFEPKQLETHFMSFVESTM